MTYQVALGFNNEGQLEDLNPQPASPGGVQAAGLTYSASGDVAPDGEFYIDLVYSNLEHEEKSTLDAQLGVTETARTREVTICVRINDNSFANFNAKVDYPERTNRTVNGWKDHTYRVHLKEEL